MGRGRTVNRQTITRRLSALVGEGEAHELLETPNFHLGGRTPQELIDSGNLAPVEIMLRDMEAREASRGTFIKYPQNEVDGIDMEVAGNPLLDRLPEYRGHGKIKRVLELLDGIERGAI